MSSWVVDVPMVVSVPRWIKCLVVGDTNVTLVAVGLLVVAKPDVDVDALVVSLAAIDASHVNVLPFAIVAINTCPKLSSDHSPGSSVTVAALTALPKLVKSVALDTVSPLLCACPLDVPNVAVPRAPLVIPVRSLELTPV
jgi:hypothetical protein